MARIAIGQSILANHKMESDQKRSSAFGLGLAWVHSCPGLEFKGLVALGAMVCPSNALSILKRAWAYMFTTLILSYIQYCYG